MARGVGQKLGPTCAFPATVTEAGLRSALLGWAWLSQVPWACCPLTRDPFPSVLSSHEATRSRWVSDDRLGNPRGRAQVHPCGLVPHRKATGLGRRLPSLSFLLPQSHLEAGSARPWGWSAPISKQESKQDTRLAAGGPGRHCPRWHSPTDCPSPSSIPAGAADGGGLSLLLGPLHYGLRGILSELRLFFVEAGWAQLAGGLLMAGETCPHGHHAPPPLQLFPSGA